MRKLIYITLIIWLSSIQLKSQEFKLSLQTGLGNYAMTDLKGFNAAISSFLPFSTKLVSDFPEYWYFRSMVSMNLNKFEQGLVYSFQSTGSRLSARDYSGEYQFDMKVKSHSPGIYLGFELFKDRKLSFSINSIFGASFSNLEIKEILIISGNTLSDDEIKLKSLNFFIEPGINFKYPISFLCLGMNLGYNIQFGNNAFYANNQKDNVLLNPVNSNPVKPDWNGFRIGLTISYTF